MLPAQPDCQKPCPMAYSARPVQLCVDTKFTMRTPPSGTTLSSLDSVQEPYRRNQQFKWTAILCVVLATLVVLLTLIVAVSAKKDDTVTEIQGDTLDLPEVPKTTARTPQEVVLRDTPSPAPAVIRPTSTQRTTLKRVTRTTRPTTTVQGKTRNIGWSTTGSPTSTESTTTTTAAPTAAPTTAPDPMKELICTVGHSAIVPAMYPPDRYCDYVYYIELIVVDNRLRAAKSQNSWELFRSRARAYRNVKPGAGFDFESLSVDKLNNLRADLALMAENNIRHHGLLNVMTHVEHMTTVLGKLKSILEKLKEMQSNDQSRRTVVALGLWDYSPTTAFDTYKKAVKEVVDTYKADTVIAISSTRLMEDEANCYAAPPVALKSWGPIFPSMVDRYGNVHTTAAVKYAESIMREGAAREARVEYDTVQKQHSELASRRFEYSNPHTVVGLSYQLGAFVYLLKKEVPDVASIPYAKCVQSNITSMDEICQTGTPEPVEKGADGYLGKNVHSYGGYLSQNETKLVFLSESTSFTYMLLDLTFSGLEFRRRLAWLVFDVHLEDRSGRCSKDFAVLKNLCESFKKYGEPKVTC